MASKLSMCGLALDADNVYELVPRWGVVEILHSDAPLLPVSLLNHRLDKPQEYFVVVKLSS